jgi:hypothetical protein
LECGVFNVFEFWAASYPAVKSLIKPNFVSVSVASVGWFVENRLVVGLLSVDAKTLRLVLLCDRLDISKILVLYRRGSVFLLRINLLFLLLPYSVSAVLLRLKS